MMMIVIVKQIDRSMDDKPINTYILTYYKNHTEYVLDE